MTCIYINTIIYTYNGLIIKPMDTIIMDSNSDDNNDMSG